MTNLVSAFQTAYEKDYDARAMLVSLLRDFVRIHRDGKYKADLMESLAVATEAQIETEQRFKLAEAALMDERALSARLQSGSEPELSTAEEIGAGSYCGYGNNLK